MLCNGRIKRIYNLLFSDSMTSSAVQLVIYWRLIDATNYRSITPWWWITCSLIAVLKYDKFEWLYSFTVSTYPLQLWSWNTIVVFSRSIYQTALPTTFLNACWMWLNAFVFERLNAAHFFLRACANCQISHTQCVNYYYITSVPYRNTRYSKLKAAINSGDSILKRPKPVATISRIWSPLDFFDS